MEQSVLSQAPVNNDVRCGSGFFVYCWKWRLNACEMGTGKLSSFLQTRFHPIVALVGMEPTLSFFVLWLQSESTSNPKSKNFFFSETFFPSKPADSCFEQYNRNLTRFKGEKFSSSVPVLNGLLFIRKRLGTVVDMAHLSTPWFEFFHCCTSFCTITANEKIHGCKESRMPFYQSNYTNFGNFEVGTITRKNDYRNYYRNDCHHAERIKRLSDCRERLDQLTRYLH